MFARNSDTASRLWGHQHRLGCRVHLDKQVLLPFFFLLGWLVYTTSRSKRSCRLCLMIGNGYDVRAIYVNR